MPTPTAMMNMQTKNSVGEFLSTPASCAAKRIPPPMACMIRREQVIRIGLFLKAYFKSGLPRIAPKSSGTKAIIPEIPL